jgi:hypothetical protein
MSLEANEPILNSQLTAIGILPEVAAARASTGAQSLDAMPDIELVFSD